MNRLACAALVLAASEARADLYAGEDLYRPPIEWSTWLRAAVALEHDTPTAIARTTAPIEHDPTHSAWDTGLGAEASLAASRHGDVRLGAWTELRGFSLHDDLYAGGELVVTRVPKRFDMFLYEGHGILAVRAGASGSRQTASIAWGYMAPFWLEGECAQRFFGIFTGVCHERPERTARMIAGVRLVATATRGAADWSASLGLEFEPVGAARMMFGIRSWYAN